jgi:hypothetical protein
MVIDGFPRGEVVPQLPPLGACLNDVQNRIDDPLAGMLASASATVIGLKVRLYQSPLFVFQITRVAQR